MTSCASGRQLEAVWMAVCTPATHSSPTAGKSPTRGRPEAHRTTFGACCAMGGGVGEGVGVGADGAIIGVGADGIEHPSTISAISKVNPKIPSREYRA